MGINKQPIFTVAPILVTADINSGGNTIDLGNIVSSCTNVFSASSPEGTLIERITVTAKADITLNNVSNKLIYLIVWDGTTYAVLKVFKFTEIVVANTNLPPSETITFEGGIILVDGNQLYVGQTAVGGDGDGLHIVIEGGTYTV